MNKRPDMWPAIKTRWFYNSARSELIDGFVFEAGADAMLEELKKKAWLCIPGDQSYLLTKWSHPKTADIAPKESTIRMYPEQKGWLVFIPEEE